MTGNSVQAQRACVLVLRLHDVPSHHAPLAGVDEAVKASLSQLGPLPFDAVTAPRMLVADARCDTDRLANLFLSPDEQAATAKIKDPRTRDTYASAHAALRLVLANACGLQPRDIPIARAAAGKPFAPIGGAPHFSLSHTAHAFAIAWGDAPMGVDIEDPAHAGSKLIEDMDAVAAQYFSRDEQARLHAAGGESRKFVFLETWTRKEALIKAAGLGLAHLAKVDTVKSPVVILDEEGASSQAYCIHSLPAGERFQLAFAACMAPANAQALHILSKDAPVRSNLSPSEPGDVMQRACADLPEYVRFAQQQYRKDALLAETGGGEAFIDQAAALIGKSVLRALPYDSASSAYVHQLRIAGISEAQLERALARAWLENSDTFQVPRPRTRRHFFGTGALLGYSVTLVIAGLIGLVEYLRVAHPDIASVVLGAPPVLALIGVPAAAIIFLVLRRIVHRHPS